MLSTILSNKTPNMIKTKFFNLFAIALLLVNPVSQAADPKALQPGGFDREKDLLLLHCDFKTDVDDVQTVAGFATLLADPAFSNIDYHVVAGTYGVQEGLYVPPNPLLQLAFGDNWTDAHADRDSALEKVKKIAIRTLSNQGHIWISEAGQSDFSAQLIKAIQADMPDLDSAQRIHVVQHAGWNEEVTSPDLLDYVKENADYSKIPDGNGVGNGTPGFRDPDFTQWKSKISDPRLSEIWQLAIDISDTYNGQDDRYLNEAIAAGGLDFSDLAAVCWILGLQDDLKDVNDFFARFSK
jgi:hypothetical protein